MEDYHAGARVKGFGQSGWSALWRALGAAALLACLVLRAGGVDIARADSPPAEADRFIRLNGEPVGTAAPTQLAQLPESAEAELVELAEPAGCQAGPGSERSGLAAGLQRLVERAARQVAPGAGGAERDADFPVALNGQGYNYGVSADRSARGR